MNTEIIFIILFSSWMVFWFVKNNRKEPEPPPKEYKVTICPGALQRLIEAAQELEEINGIQWKLDYSIGSPWTNQVRIDYAKNGKHIVDFTDTRNREELQKLVDNQREALTSRIIDALAKVTVVEKTEKKQRQGRGQ
ncbi:MAG: hypothetical protein IJY74_04935 [Oscillospiraceae bacterium]|nr:hypothetical protein [Oscillospiraceae bacterium]